MEIRSTILKKHNVKMNHIPIAKYHSKSYPLLFCGLAGGILCLYFQQYLIGTIFLAASIYLLLFVKNIVLMEFFPDCALFLCDVQNHQHFLLYYSDIVDYQVVKRCLCYDDIIVQLRNHQEIKIKCSNCKMVIKYFDAALKERR